MKKQQVIDQLREVLHRLYDLNKNYVWDLFIQKYAAQLEDLEYRDGIHNYIVQSARYSIDYNGDLLKSYNDPLVHEMEKAEDWLKRYLEELTPADYVRDKFSQCYSEETILLLLRLYFHLSQREAKKVIREYHRQHGRKMRIDKTRSFR